MKIDLSIEYNFKVSSNEYRLIMEALYEHQHKTYSEVKMAKKKAIDELVQKLKSPTIISNKGGITKIIKSGGDL